MSEHILAIAVNTFRETIRDRILLGVAVFGAFLIFFSLFLGSISLEQDTKIIQDVGLATIFILELFISVFVGTHLVYKEVERRTIFMIIPKPVRRGEIIFGKFTGLILTNLLVTFLTTLILFGILIFKMDISSASLGILAAIFFGLLESAILLVISIFFSTLTSPILSALYTMGIFAIGHSANLIFAVIDKQAVILKQLLYALYFIFPNLEKFNIRNEVIYGILPDPWQVFSTILYAFSYAAFIFIASILLFHQKEF